VTLRTPQHKGRGLYSPLTVEQVRQIVAEKTVNRPLSTKDITLYCHVLHGVLPGITTTTVGSLLAYLLRRGRVVSYSGDADGELLDELGVNEPQPHTRYWSLSHPKKPE
jgi:hypothetical protein